MIDAATVEINREDPVGSDHRFTYRAMRDVHDPHILHGGFEAADGGGDYEESFSWVLATDGRSFQQVSEFFYLAGPSAGAAGDCGGTATRN